MQIDEIIRESFTPHLTDQSAMGAMNRLLREGFAPFGAPCLIVVIVLTKLVMRPL